MYKRYDKYKDSGVEWIGEIPEHWSVNKLGYFLKKNDGGVWGDDPKENGVMVLRSTEITLDGRWNINEPARRSLSNKEYSNALLVKNDLLLTKSSGSEQHIGKTAIVDDSVAKLRSAFSNFMQRLRANKMLFPKYLYYFLNTNGREQLLHLSTTTTGLKNLSGAIINNLKVQSPTIDEQITIAHYLDHKTSEIDSLIADKEKLIKKLEEYKQSIITEAVTKGLNPDVKMKDSGIEWIGEIPEHWEIKKLKHVVDLINVKSDNENLPYIGLEHIVSLTGKYMQPASPPQPEAEANLFEVEDVLFGKLRPYLAKVFMPTFHGRCSSEFLVLRSKSIQRMFLFYSVLSHHFINIVNASTYGAKMPRASWNYIGDLPLSIPPEIEQEEIHKLLDTRIISISVIIEDSKYLIQMLKSYRQSLIYEAVSGKIDVRDYQFKRSEQFA